MGHVRHHDWLFLMLSHALVAVLWFNPFVWRLQRELARQSEQAADAWAVRRIDRADYAGALVAMARGVRPHAALGMAGPSSDLARRVAAVLDPSHGKGRPWITAVAAIACVALAGPLAALEWAPEAPPAALRPTGAPAKATAAPTTAAAVVALLPAALAPSPSARPAEDLSPEALAVLVQQREQGLAMMEAGARAMEASAFQMRNQARLVSNPQERAGLRRDADKLATEAQTLRAKARDLALRDPATLMPMSEAEERAMAREMQALLTVPMQMGLAMESPMGAEVHTGVQVDLAPRPMPLPISLAASIPPAGPTRDDEAAGKRDAARRLRSDAARMDADALRIEQDQSQPEDAINHASDLRDQASELRQEADDLDREAADVMSG